MLLTEQKTKNFVATPATKEHTPAPPAQKPETNDSREGFFRSRPSTHAGGRGRETRARALVVLSVKFLQADQKKGGLKSHAASQVYASYFIFFLLSAIT